MKVPASRSLDSFFGVKAEVPGFDGSHRWRVDQGFLVLYFKFSPRRKRVHVRLAVAGLAVTDLELAGVTSVEIVRGHPDTLEIVYRNEARGDEDGGGACCRITILPKIYIDHEPRTQRECATKSLFAWRGTGRDIQRVN